ncbi:MAG: hypothetical protein K0Q79_37 [Flavipsychrobacter sp.]|jgi:hypothetical protein|nr:hypothetical protein [Flavipsychrobacter sp.]
MFFAELKEPSYRTLIAGESRQRIGYAMILSGYIKTLLTLYTYTYKIIIS